MTELAWALVGISGCFNLILIVKICRIHKSIREIAAAFSDRLTTDTNTLIDISTRDRTVCCLAASINEQLRILRKQRHRYLSGDRELKEAVTNISHDLRTPLTAISGYLELLEREKKPPEAGRYLGLIKERTEVMKQLTEELFRYSVILSADEAMTTEPVNLNAVLEESIAAFYTALTERSITPVIEIPETAVIRHLNRTAVSRIFGNILSNVLKYSDGDLEIRMEMNGRITFTNTAVLDEIQVGRLFDRFFTVEAARHSTGLGLAIAKTLAERMGGTIQAIYRNGRLSIGVYFSEKENPIDALRNENL